MIQYLENVFLTSVTASGDPEAVFNGVGENVKEGKFSEAMKLIGDFFVFLYNEYKSPVAHFALKIITALIIYFIGKKIVKSICNIAERALERSRVELSVTKFLNKLINIILNCVLFICVVGALGVPTTSFIALLGTMGLAIGLSLQGSLSNFAGGVLILLLKPFRVNDYIIADGLEGKVKTIDVFYTKIISGDNKVISIPNGTLANTSIQNVPNSAKRRIDYILPVDYDADINKIRKVLIELAQSNEKVILDEGINVFVDSLGDSAINIGFRVWVRTVDYWDVRWELLEKVVYKFREENISIPFNQLDVMIKNEKSTMNVM